MRHIALPLSKSLVIRSGLGPDFIWHGSLLRAEFNKMSLRDSVL